MLTVSGNNGRSFGNGFKLHLIEPLARHLDQLSARDCIKLLALMRREFAQPDPIFTSLEADRQYRHGQINIGEAVKLIAYGSDDEQNQDTNRPLYVSKGDRKDAADFLAANPIAAALLTQSVQQRIDAYFGDIQARYMAFPVVAAADTASLTPGPSVTGMSAADRIADRIVMFSTQPAGTEQFIVESMMRVRAYERLLAVHAAICSYRWENSRLPDDLAELKLRDLALDPFSGKPFVYKLGSNHTYTLESVGCAKRDDDANPIPGGKPVPINLVPALP